MSTGTIERSRARLWLAAALSGLALAIAGCGGGDDGGSTFRPSEAPKPGEPGGPAFGKNTIRLPGTSASDLAASAVLANYPPERKAKPNGWVLFQEKRWHNAVIGAQFAADPVGAAMLPIDPDFLPTAAFDLLRRTDTPGFPNADGLETLILGRAGPDVITALQDQEQKLTQLDSPTPARLAADLVPFRGGWSGRFSDVVLVISSEHREYGLAAAAWSAFSGDTVAFVSPQGVPSVTAALLNQRQQVRIDKPTIYVFGPRSVISDSVADDLDQYGPVKRIAGDARNPVEAAIAFARYEDSGTGFGWGTRGGPANLSFVNQQDPENAYAALNLASAGPRSPLLWLQGSKRLPGALVDYLEDLRGDEPSQGYVVGDTESIPEALFEQLDGLLNAEK